MLKMNTDKENIKMPTRSKIPLPLDPLPVLSEHLLKISNNGESERRCPLKTINNQQPNADEAAGPSKKTKKVFNESNCNTMNVLKIDTRHVTLRKEKEDLDWNYKVFKDELEEAMCKVNSIPIREDESVDIHIADKKIVEARKIATPVLSSLEPSRVRNIKRSLKRPHSRELLGVISTAKQEKGDNEKIKRRLDFNCFNENLQAPDNSQKLYMKCLYPDYTFEMFEYLLSTEQKHTCPRIPSITRACVINWLIKVNGVHGDPAIVQMACWYFDAILSEGCLRLEKLQLIAVACYWISQKVCGPTFKASRLVKYANNAFTVWQLMAAEKAVLMKLNFPRQPIVPQDYIAYLSWYCDNIHHGEIEIAATFICTVGMMVNKRLCSEYPSVLAAAAVKNGLLLMKKTDLTAHLETCNLMKAIEKKSSHMHYVCSMLRKAVRLMWEPSYEYKAPFEQYGGGPHYIAHKVVHAANEMVAYRALQKYDQ